MSPSERTQWISGPVSAGRRGRDDLWGRLDYRAGAPHSSRGSAHIDCEIRALRVRREVVGPGVRHTWVCISPSVQTSLGQCAWQPGASITCSVKWS